MKKSKRAGYFVIIGFVTCIVSIALIVGLVVSMVNGFKDHLGAWSIIKDCLNILAVVGVGFGLTNLFYSHACMIDDDSGYCK